MTKEEIKLTEDQQRSLEYHEQQLRNISKSVGLGFGHDCRYDSTKPDAITRMYIAFCDLEKAKLNTVALEEHAMWAKYEGVQNNAK